MGSNQRLFERGLIWEDWLAELGDDAPAWRERQESAQAADQATELATLTGPLRLLAISDAESAAARAALPVLARLVAHAPDAIELRVVHAELHTEEIRRAVGFVPSTLPLCFVLDEDWVATARWSPASGTSLEPGSLTRELVGLLRPEPAETRGPWKTLTRHLWRQAERARAE